MIEHSPIEFLDKHEQFDFDRDVVLFEGMAVKGEVSCAISGEALEDHYGAKGSSGRARLAAFHAHRKAIEEQARRKFAANKLEKDGSMLLRSEDIVGEQ